MAFDADACRIADKGDAFGGIEVADVVRRMARSVKNLKVAGAEGESLPTLKNLKICFGHGKEISKEALHVISIKAASALEEHRGIGHVRGTAGMHINLQAGIFLDERARSAGVIEMDVGEKKGIEVADAKIVNSELFAECVESRGRTGINQGAKVAGAQESRCDGAWMAGPVEVERGDNQGHGRRSLAYLWAIESE